MARWIWLMVGCEHCWNGVWVGDGGEMEGREVIECCKKSNQSIITCASNLVGFEKKKKVKREIV